MRHAVITTPHEFCESHAAVLDHACDTVAEYAGRALTELLAGKFRITPIRGDVNRRRLDLNRKAAHHSEFQRQIDDALRPGDMLLDVHSYPGAAADDVMQDWGQYDLVLPAYRNVNEKESERLCAELRRRGVRCKTESPDRVPDLSLYYVILRFGPRARPGFMFEFDEDKGLTRLNHVLGVLAATLVDLYAKEPVPAVAGRRMPFRPALSSVVNPSLSFTTKRGGVVAGAGPDRRRSFQRPSEVAADDPRLDAYMAFVDRWAEDGEVVELYRLDDGRLELAWWPPDEAIRDEVAWHGWEAVYGFPLEWFIESAMGQEVRELLLEGSVVRMPLSTYVLPAGVTGGIKGWVNGFIERWHRHSSPVTGWKAAVLAVSGRFEPETETVEAFEHALSREHYPLASVVGIAIVSRPVSRRLAARALEVTRVATWPVDPRLSFNAASMLYGAAGREIRRLGYEVAYTYTLASRETGGSVRGAGFLPDAWRRAERGRSPWSRPSRKRSLATPGDPKIRWMRRLWGPTSVIRVLELNPTQRRMLVEGRLTGADLPQLQRERMRDLIVPGMADETYRELRRGALRLEDLVVPLQAGDQIVEVETGRHMFWDVDQWRPATEKDYRRSELFRADQQRAEQVMREWRAAALGEQEQEPQSTAL